MPQEKLIIAIGRMERALSRVEQSAKLLSPEDSARFEEKLDNLKSVTRNAIREIDSLIGGNS
jgi:hypothetical protein